MKKINFETYLRYAYNVVTLGQSYNRQGNYEAERNMRILIQELQRSNPFIIEDEIKEMLMNTTNEVSDRKLPFDNFFLNVNFEFEHKNIIHKVYGLHIVRWLKEQVPYLMLNFDDDHTIHQQGFPLFKKFSLNEIIKKHELDGLWMDVDFLTATEKTIKKIQLFVINFLDFLNNPEVEYFKVDRVRNKKGRFIKRWKENIESVHCINITGKLKIYLNELKSNGHFAYSHRFWVRGHFRTLRNEVRYKDKVGMKIWIPPFIKGEGILINKTYDVKKTAGGNTQPSAGASHSLNTDFTGKSADFPQTPSGLREI